MVAGLACPEAGRKLGLTRPWGPKAQIQPLVSVAAAPEDTLATYSDGSPAVALRRSAQGLDAFVGVPQISPELGRALAKLAGAHLFTEGPTTVWAAERFISFQALEAGPLVVDTGQAGRVFDALDGTPLGNGPQVKLDVKQGEVRVLRY